ncbi:MAG: DNA repair protein RadC [Oscillospiraceae bacterium]
MTDEHQGHRERLKERFLKNGLGSFAPHEILELLLFYSIPRNDTNPIAHRLLERFGSLTGVFEASPKSLAEVPGVGSGSATLLSLIPQISMRYMDDKNDIGVILDTTRKLGNFILPKFIGQNNERMLLICLDMKMKLLCCKFLSEGNIDSVNINIREIVKQCMDVSASVVVIAHNHTQGFAMPSDADKFATITLLKTLAPLSIELIDHIIVARDDYVSLKESGFFAMR